MLVLLLSNSYVLFSQLQLTNNSNASNLAQSIVGNGITITNAKLRYKGFPTAAFSNMGTKLGLSKGILLTTGDAIDASGSGTYFCNVNNGNDFSDPDLVSISKKAIYNVCILEFDFIPICDTLRIEYVFASDEYPQAVYNSYNDVFAMFLSGQNPKGGNYNSKNIATLPNGITPVSIDSINAGWPTSSNASHPDFFIDNYHAPNSEIAYNGYTKPIISKVALIPCKTYHLKIAIADAGNWRYDSGVFIKENSFQCTNVPSVNVSTLSSCNNTGTVSVNISNTMASPGFTWFPGGENSSSLKNVIPGSYTCEVNVPGTCSNYTVTAIVPETQSVKLHTRSQFVCSGKKLQLEADGSQNYLWTPSKGLTGDKISNPIANPDLTTTYTLLGTAVNGCTSSAVITISTNPKPFIINFSASKYETSLDSSTIQFTDNTQTAVAWHWDFEAGQSSSEKEPSHNFNEPGTYWVTLTASDQNNCSASLSKKVVINDILKDLYSFYMPNSFTPNNDEVNDVLLPRGIGWDLAGYNFEIYNNWGKKIFHSQDPYKGWNGKLEDKLVDAGAYVYKLTIKDIYRNYHEYTGVAILLK